MDHSLLCYVIAYLIALVRLWSFPPTMLKLSKAVRWPVVLSWSQIGEGNLRCSLNLSKYTCRFISVFFITFNPGTLVSVDNSTLLCDGISIFGGHQEDLAGSVSFDMYLYPMQVLFFFGSSGLFLLLVFLEGLIWVLFLIFNLSEWSGGILVSLLWLPYVFLFFMWKLWVGTNSSCSVCKDFKHTIFSNNVVMAVPVQILATMTGISVHSCGKCSVWFWYDQSV